MAMAQQQQQTAQPVGLGGGGKTSAAATTATTTVTTNSNNTTVVNQNQQQQQGDTTYTKIFVGGLAWETKRETMKKYFEQFGEIQEAVVIMDKNTGRSKGYGFVTFRDREAAKRACADPSPVIDGRRANCNLASLGASRSRPSPPQHSRPFISFPLLVFLFLQDWIDYYCLKGIMIIDGDKLHCNVALSSI